MPKTTPQKAHQEYTQGLQFMHINNYLKISKRNERFLLGDQWWGLVVRMLDTPVVNVIKRIIDFKIATILSPDIAVMFSPQGFVEGQEPTEPEEGEKLEQTKLAMEGFNAQVKKDSEHIGQDEIDEDVLTSSAIGGMALAYYWWDNHMVTGNEEIAIGGIKGKQIDGINFFPANPSQYISGNFDDLEDQEYIILTYNTSVFHAKQIARSHGVDEVEIEKIVPSQKDHDTTFTKGEHELVGKERVTIKVRMYMGEEPEEDVDEENAIDLDKREEPDELEQLLGKPSTIRFQQFTEHVEIQPDTNTKLSMYPVSPMYWDKRKDFIYGKPEISSMITNQVFLNKILAMAMASLARTAFPKLLYDADRVSKPSNTIGGSLGISGLINQGVQGAIGYLEGKGVAQDVFQLFDKVLAVTKDVHGANENALGEARPENTSAAIAQQKQANIPLRSLRNRYKRYRERCARIELNFYTVNFNTPRQLAIKDKTGKPASVTFTGTDFAMINWETKVDMPETTQFSESLAITVLMEMLNAEMISFRQFLERYPEGIIPKKGELLNEVKEQEEASKEAQANGDDFDQLSQIFQGLNEEQRKAVLNSDDPAQAVRDL